MPTTMPLGDFIESSAVSLFGYGIVNPFGPTFMGFSLCATADDTLELVFFSLNPFAQSVDRIAVYRPVAKGVALDQLFAQYHVYADIRRFIKARMESGTESGTPTLFFDAFINNPSFMNAERRDTARTIIRLSSDPKRTLTGLTRFPLNVMERVSDEMGNAGSMSESSAQSGPTATDAQVDQILSIICDEKHLKQELKGFIYGWNGAIEFQKTSGSGALAKDALQPVEAIQLILSLFPSIGDILGIPK